MVQNQKTPRQKAEELTSWYMNNRSAKMSDDTRIEWPSAKHFSLKTVQELLNLSLILIEKGSIEQYGYYSKVYKEIENL